MNLTRCHLKSSVKFTRVQRKWRKVLKIISWNLSAERRKHIHWSNSTLKGKARKQRLCPESVAANANVRGKFGSHLRLYFGFKDSLLVKNFSIGRKVSSRNSASETFFDFIYLLWSVQWSPYFSTFSMLNETKLIVLRFWLVWWNRIVWSFHANNLF